MGLGLSLRLHVSIRRGKNDFNQLGVFFLLINRNSRRRIDTQQFQYISFSTESTYLLERMPQIVGGNL